MKKYITIGLIALLTIIVIWFGFSMFNKIQSAQTQDYVLVYNASGKKIKRISTKKDITYLSDSLGNLAGKQNGFHKKVPDNSQIAYHYAMYQVKPKYKIDMYVYKNSNHLSLKGLPFVSYGTWRTDDQLSNKLHNPSNFK
ncbi:hypothetical protein IWT25_02204 [Secundilactobacillus pentosiphilus]|uniref:Uncharacterized protein n=1 Tax=Secundilactobacillus pentosiphilus TaxID=1714682 RepID=A0A1Z5IYN0_9LACO|nr:hypothetical protein [Secundilactobacillus pentosiphilus]GAX06857.1 hypothetical protein IWT25_02204 [Secundilactobacillus pentosiphilus]